MKHGHHGLVVEVPSGVPEFALRLGWFSSDWIGGGIEDFEPCGRPQPICVVPPEVFAVEESDLVE